MTISYLINNMPITTTTNLLNNSYVLVLAKGAILLILFLYAIFALIIVRQVDLMGKTLVTNISGILKAIAIVHAGFAVGLIFLAWGLL